MKLNVKKLLNDIEGKPIMSGDANEQFQACLGHLCVVALTTDMPSDNNESGDKKFHRWQLARGFKNAIEKEEGIIELPVHDVDLVKKRIGMVFQTKIVGPAYEAIESNL